MILKYFEYLRDWKKLPKGLKTHVIAGLIRNGLFMLLGVVLYLLLNDTGLLIYIILILKYHEYERNLES